MSSTDVSTNRIVDHYDGIIRELESPPIIVGHSFGGALTEVLLDRGRRLPLRDPSEADCATLGGWMTWRS